jgi:energy-coupling factor transporter ATP-binding protein EcfA2
MHLIRVDNFSFKYIDSQDYAVKNVSFVVDKGEFLVLAGPSGCGKTTLARALIGLIPQFYSGDYEGRIEVLGMDPAKTPISKISSKVGFLFQNPENQIFMTTVERDIAFSLEFRAYPIGEMRKRVWRAMEVLHITHLAGRRIEDLSGGEKQKVALAGLLALEPEILILDEPTSYLSPSSAYSLIHFLDELRRSEGMTILMIDHRLDIAFEVADRILIMKEGELKLDIPLYEIYKYNLSKEYGINIPTLLKISYILRRRGIDISPFPPTIDKFVEVLSG